MRPLPAVLYAPDRVVGDATPLLQLSQGENPLSPQFLKNGRLDDIHSIDDRYDHDVDELMA
jgi:hypothetical protein